MDINLEHVSPVGLSAIILTLSIYFYIHHNKQEKSFPHNISLGKVININRYPIKGLSPTKVIPETDPYLLHYTWRLLHSLGAVFYLFSSIELYHQHKTIEWILNGLAFICSILWSMTRYGGHNSLLMHMDHLIAYLVIGFNYALACNWNDGLLGFFYGSWTTIQMNGFMVCHLAIPVFFLEDVLRNRCRMDVRIHYGVCHFVWRVIGGYGGYLVAKGCVGGGGVR